MRWITESLAGRVAILDLLGFSQAEIEQRDQGTSPFLPTAEWLRSAEVSKRSENRLMEIYQSIWLGSFPRVVLAGAGARDVHYGSYVQTYIQRDVRALERLGGSTANIGSGAIVCLRASPVALDSRVTAIPAAYL